MYIHPSFCSHVHSLQPYSRSSPNLGGWFPRIGRSYCFNLIPKHTLRLLTCTIDSMVLVLKDPIPTFAFPFFCMPGLFCGIFCKNAWCTQPRCARRHLFADILLEAMWQQICIKCLRRLHRIHCRMHSGECVLPRSNPLPHDLPVKPKTSF